MRLSKKVALRVVGILLFVVIVASFKLLNDHTVSNYDWDSVVTRIEEYERDSHFFTYHNEDEIHEKLMELSYSVNNFCVSSERFKSSHSNVCEFFMKRPKGYTTLEPINVAKETIVLLDEYKKQRTRKETINPTTQQTETPSVEVSPQPSSVENSEELELSPIEETDSSQDIHSINETYVDEPTTELGESPSVDVPHEEAGPAGGGFISFGSPGEEGSAGDCYNEDGSVRVIINSHGFNVCEGL